MPDAGPPDGPAVCGDGWRDPLTEECDDGANSDPAGTCDENCRVCDTLVEPRPPGDGPLRPPSRLIAEGRHPVAAGDSGFAVAFVEREQPNGTIMLKTFGPAGVPGPAAIALNAPAAFTPADADPVITALPGGKYAVAWNDLGGDGDSLGIALAIASPGATPARTFANAGRRLSQHGPDIIATDSEIVVAWEDDDTEVIGSALRLRRFSLSGTPLSATDQTLSAEPSGAVALSRFGSGWAAAWRGRVDTREVIRVKGGTAQWSADVASPAPAGERPALVELDATRLLVVFSETTFPDGGGSTTRVRLAVADVAAPGALTSLPLEPLVAPYSTDPTLGQSQAAVVRAGGSVYLAWRAERVLGDAFSEELWLKRIGVTLSSTEVTLDWSEAEIRLPRSEEQRRGDQRFAALAASSSALFAAWDDYGRTFGLAQGGPDVVVSLIPTPILRLEPLELGR